MTDLQADGTPFGIRLRQLAAEQPDRAALTCAGITRTRDELVRNVERLASHLVGLGVCNGDLVTIGLPNSVEFVEAAFAVWWLGATPQPVSSGLVEVERRAIIELAQPSLLIGLPADETDATPGLRFEDLQAVISKPTADPAPASEPAAASRWKAVTSGGSTGRPKLIVATQPAVHESVAPLGALVRLPEEGTILAPGPLSHNSPLVISTVGLLGGNHVILMPRFDAIECLRLIERHRAHWLYMVPTMMHRIWRLPERERLAFDVSSLQAVLHTAAPCPRWLKREWIGWLGAERILELYGGTELQALTVITGTEWLEHFGSVGKVVVGEIECRSRESGDPLPAERVGELWLRRGEGQPAPYTYIGAEPKATDDGWESLGDLGFIDAEGYVYITDRETDMILSGGRNIYPAEIEAALDEHPDVRSSCVIGLPDEDLGNLVHALVQTDEAIDINDLLAHLRERLTAYKLPRSFELVQHALRDEAGKMRRSAIRDQRIQGQG